MENFIHQQNLALFKKCEPYRTNPSPLTKLVGSIEKEYRELLDLRERIKKAEAVLRSGAAHSRRARSTHEVANGRAGERTTAQLRQF
jgi:hypothetical protein